MAERYSKRRFLSNFGATQGPKGPDVSGLSRAMGARQQALSTGLDAIQTVLTDKLKKGAEKRAAQNAINNDPYVLMQQTEGSINYEDELTRKHAITKIGNDTLSSIALQITEAEQESAINDESSTIFNNKITNIIRDNIKNLRDTGVDSPILELEIQESIVGTVRQRVTSYAASRIKFKETQHQNEVKNKLLNLTDTAARTGEDLDIQNLNNAKIEYQDFLNNQPGFAGKLQKNYELGKMKKFSATTDIALENAGTKKQLLEIYEKSTELRNSLGEAAPDNILALHDSITEKIQTRLGSKQSAIEIYADRNTKSQAEYYANEQQNYLGDVIGIVNAIDAGVFNGSINNTTDLEFLYRLLGTDVSDATGFVPTEIETVNRDFIKQAVALSLKEYNQDPGGFAARRNNKPINAISEGFVDIETLKERYRMGVFTVSAADMTELEKLSKLDTKNFFTSMTAIMEPIKKAGIDGQFFQDVYAKADADTSLKFNTFFAADDAGVTDEYIRGKIKLEQDKLKPDSLTDAFTDLFDSTKSDIADALTIKLGQNANLKPDNYTAYFDLAEALMRENPNRDIDDVLDQILLNKENDLGQITNGYFTIQPNRYNDAQIFLNADTTTYQTTSDDIVDGLNRIDTESMYVLKKKFNFETAEYEYDNSRILTGTLPMTIDGTTFGTSTELTAQKLKSDYKFRMLDKSDILNMLSESDRINYPLIIPGGLVVAQGIGKDGKPTIVMNADNTPAIFDISEIGYLEKNVLSTPTDVDTGINVPQISEVTATSRFRSQEDISGPISKNLSRTIPIDKRSDVQKILDFRKSQ